MRLQVVHGHVARQADPWGRAYCLIWSNLDVAFEPPQLWNSTTTNRHLFPLGLAEDMARLQVHRRHRKVHCPAGCSPGRHWAASTSKWCSTCRCGKEPKEIHPLCGKIQGNPTLYDSIPQPFNLGGIVMQPIYLAIIALAMALLGVKGGIMVALVLFFVVSNAR